MTFNMPSLWPFGKRSGSGVSAGNGSIGVGGGVHDSTFNISNTAKPTDGMATDHLAGKTREELGRFIASLCLTRGETLESIAEATSRAVHAVQALPDAAREIGKPQAVAAAEQALLDGNPEQAKAIFRELADAKEREGMAAFAEAADALRHLAAVAYLNNKAQALASLKRAAELAPDHINVLLDLGAIARDAGELETAINAYQHRLSLAEQAQDERGIAMMCDLLTVLMIKSGNLPKAMSFAERALNIAIQKVEREPHDKEAKSDLSVSHRTFGDTLRAHGDLKGALHAYDLSLKISTELATTDINDPQLQRGLSVSYERFGNILQDLGDPIGALQSFVECYTIVENLAAAEPYNLQRQRDLAISYNKIGDISGAQGDFKGALHAYTDSLNIIKNLAVLDPTNATWESDLGLLYIRIGDTRREQNDLTNALQEYDSSLNIRKKLASADLNNADWQRQLAVSNERIGHIHLKNNHQGLARQAFLNALNIYNDLVVRNASDFLSKLNSVVPHWQLASLDPENARTHLKAALDILRPLAAEDRLDSNRRGWIKPIEDELKALK